MKYRHQYHAGNFADVHKHVLLLEVLRALTRKEKGLLFVDTHAGRGEYELHPGDKEHPAEWQAGAARLLAAEPRHETLRKYRDLLVVGRRGGSLLYPGSPLLALGQLRDVDRAVFFEMQREESGHLRKLVTGRTRVESGDGFAGPRAAAAAGAARLHPHRSALRRARGFRACCASCGGHLAALRERRAGAMAPGEAARGLRHVARQAAPRDRSTDACLAAMDPSLRFARRTEWLRAGGDQPALSSRGSDARMAARSAGGARRTAIRLRG